MPDLRRQVLESGKTVSRKARSRQVSGAVSAKSSAANSRVNSAASSRAHSRAPSRAASDDEEGFMSDETAWSTNSIDDLLAEDVDETPDAWSSALHDRIEQIIDRKRSSAQGREESLMSYTHLLLAHYGKDEISSKLGELFPAMLRSVKNGSTDKETSAALKAIAITVITDPEEDLYDSSSKILKQTVSDAQSSAVKTSAIHTLGVATFYGGADTKETEDIMDFFLSIVESDGVSIDAEDSSDVVVAALEEWGFLATQLDDLEEITETAMEAFVEQLDSSDAHVQIAAGENIALIYEKGHFESADSDDEDGEENFVVVPRYTIYRQEHQLKHTLESLAKTSGPRVSKQDRKSLRTNFADILSSVEDPARGPRYSSAEDHVTGKEYGSRMKVRIHRSGEMKIDRWWKLHRLQALRRALQGGFVNHYEHNDVIFESLPILIEKNGAVGGRPGRPGKHSKHFGQDYLSPEDAL